MADKKRLIDAKQANRATYEEVFWTESEQAVVRNFLAKLPKVDAVEVVRIEEVRQTILQTLDTLIATHRDISNSQFSDYEKCLDIPESSNDYYGIKAEAYETARRLVNAALIDLCS